MPILNSINQMLNEMKSWRQDLHKIPEIGLEEYETSKYIKNKLKEFNINFKEEFSDLNVNLQSLNLTRLCGFLLGSKRLKSLLTTLSPDVIHSQGLRADWLCAKLGTYPVRITTQRNNPVDDYRSLYGSLIGFTAAWLHHHQRHRGRNPRGDPRAFDLHRTAHRTTGRAQRHGERRQRTRHPGVAGDAGGLCRHRSRQSGLPLRDRYLPRFSRYGLWRRRLHPDRCDRLRGLPSSK